MEMKQWWMGTFYSFRGRNGVDKHPWKQEEGSVKEGDREAKEEREKPWSGP